MATTAARIKVHPPNARLNCSIVVRVVLVARLNSCSNECGENRALALLPIYFTSANYVKGAIESSKAVQLFIATFLCLPFDGIVVAESRRVVFQSLEIRQTQLKCPSISAELGVCPAIEVLCLSPHKLHRVHRTAFALLASRQSFTIFEIFVYRVFVY